MSVGLFSQNFPLAQKLINQHSTFVIYNQLYVSTYQKYISTIYHQQVITTMNTKNTRCMYNLFLLRTTILGVYQQQLNRVQIYKRTNSICKTRLTFSAPIEMRQQSSTDINLSTGTQHVSSASRVCTRPGSLQPTCECGQCIMQQAYASKQLGFFFSSHAQILCNLQSLSLMSSTVQNDPQPVTTHPSSPIACSCSTINQYECYLNHV